MKRKRKNKSKTPAPYLLIQSFFQLLSDAIFFERSAKDSSDVIIAQRYAKASIINSIMTLESAANSCLTQMKHSRKFLDEVDKLTSFAKFDLYALYRNAPLIDRGNTAVQKVAELKTLRDRFVHPKQEKAKLDISLDDTSDPDFAHIGLSFSRNPLNATRIDTSSEFWFETDATNALLSVIEFFNHYFLTVLQLKHEEVIAILGTKVVFDEKTNFLLHKEQLELEFEYLAEQGIHANFLRLSSLPVFGNVKN